MEELFKIFFSSKFTRWANTKSGRRQRILVLSFIFGLGYFAIIIQLLKINNLTIENVESQLFTQKIERKDIVDRNGYVLATNLPTCSLYANPKKIFDPENTAKKLKSVVPKIKVNNLIEKLSANKSFVWVQRDLSPKDKENIIALGLTGLYFEDNIKRVYTQGNNTAHILGFVDTDNKGIAGIEKHFDEYLSDAKNSDPLKLSVDYRVQNIVSQELDKSISKFSALGGVGIVADVNTGEIISMVSKPDFNPANITNSPKDNLFNRATLASYEVGSVLKAIAFAIAFDTKTIAMNDVYKISEFTLRKRRIKDYYQGMEGWKTVPQIFMKSSNVGSAMIAMEVGKEKYYDYFEKLGLLEKLSIELPERSKPQIPDIKNVTDLRLVTISYGYGFSMSPMHFVQGMIPVVNGGELKPVTLLKKEESIQGEKIFADSTSNNMIKLMRLTVQKGSGRRANVKGYLVAGKTGTSNKLIKGKEYSDKNRYSSFIGVSPAVDPKYIVYVFLDDPRGIKETFGKATGGLTAAPTAAKMIERINTLYGIEPYDENDKELKKLLEVEYEVKKPA